MASFRGMDNDDTIQDHLPLGWMATLGVPIIKTKRQERLLERYCLPLFSTLTHRYTPERAFWLIRWFGSSEPIPESIISVLKQAWEHSQFHPFATRQEAEQMLRDTVTNERAMVVRLSSSVPNTFSVTYRIGDGTCNSTRMNLSTIDSHVSFDTWLDKNRMQPLRYQPTNHP